MIRIVVLLLILSSNAHAERLKDLASISGIRSNPLVGYGLVVGLDGSGDKETFTKQSFKSMLNSLGVTIPSNVTPSIKNVAAVAIHAELPPFAKPGQKIDITISSIGDAKSLRGGTLLMAPLKAANGEVFALAQGSLIVGGLASEGRDGSRITVNVPVVGRIPNGATIERQVRSPFEMATEITFNLHQSDFTTARRVALAINQMAGPQAATAIDATSIVVKVPEDKQQKVAYMAALESLNIKPGDTPARIIVNSRTGTIVIGQHVTVGPAAISHGNLTVTITESPEVSQPQALSLGTTETIERSEVIVSQANSRMFLMQPDVSLESIVKAVNQVGAAPGDLMAILEALKQAGALNADLQII